MGRVRYEQVLNAELHARPFLMVEAPARLLHMALVKPDVKPDGRRETGDGPAVSNHDLLAELCRLLGRPHPDLGQAHQVIELPGLQLKWEQHTEFITATLLLTGLFDDPFDGALLRAVPADWWARICGRVLSAAQVAIMKDDPAHVSTVLHSSPVPGAHHFTGGPLAGAMVMGDGARVMSDFRIEPDGCSRFLLCDVGLREQQAGRLIQRILEIETYGMMALLALPMARRFAAQVADAEVRIADLTERMSASPDGEVEQGLLTELTGLGPPVWKA